MRPVSRNLWLGALAVLALAVALSVAFLARGDRGPQERLEPAAVHDAPPHPPRIPADPSTAVATVPFHGDAPGPVGPILVAGRVVDHERRPQPDVRVRAVATVADDGGRPRPRPPIFATTGGDGTFRFEGSLPEGSYLTLRAIADGAWGAELNTWPKDDRAVLVLKKHGGLAGRLVLPQEGMAGAISARLENEAIARPGSDASWRLLELAKDGSFSARDLAPGPWSLRIAVAGEELARLGPFEVPPGETLELAELRTPEVASAALEARATVEIVFEGGVPSVDGVPSYELSLRAASDLDPRLHPARALLRPGATGARLASVDVGRWDAVVIALRSGPAGEPSRGRPIKVATIEVPFGSSEVRASVRLEAAAVHESLEPARLEPTPSSGRR